MKKAAMLAILGAVAAGAAAVCAKVIRDRQNEAEDEYTECPCGCSEEGDGQEQNSQPETAEQPVSEEFYQEEEPAETPPTRKPIYGPAARYALTIGKPNFHFKLTGTSI